MPAKPHKVFSRRESGILLPVSALGGRFGCGDLGPAAYRFIDFLVDSGMHWWQVLPNVPLGYGNSPYQAPSAFAGNPLYVSLEQLVEVGLLKKGDLPRTRFSASTVQYSKITPIRTRALKKAFAIFKQQKSRFKHSWAIFLKNHSSWLDPFALFMTYKEQRDNKSWIHWKGAAKTFSLQAIHHLSAAEVELFEFHRFVQWCYWMQWQELKGYATKKHVRILGDLPIYVALDSADVWANPKLFYLQTNGKPSAVAGVPPDDFSATGQLWGNPLYRWGVLKKTDYAWWVHRIDHSLKQFDAVRLDHFIGFQRYWKVPGRAKTAKNGKYLKGPGLDFFKKVSQTLGRLPVVAEDLGRVTPEVHALRDQLGYPGMRVVQFAFGADPEESLHAPHNIPENAVAYTGTHDNNTTVGWYRSMTKQKIWKYLGEKPKDIHWALIQEVLASSANTAIIPMQDILGLGASARFNYPGKPSGNWRWRSNPRQLTAALANQIQQLNKKYGRYHDC